MFAVIHIPNFGLQTLLRHEPRPDLPAVMVDSAVAKDEITELNAAAASAGVLLGMSSTQGLARCSVLQIKSRSLSQEKIAREALLQCLHGFSPGVEETAADSWTLDLKGFVDLDLQAWCGAIMSACQLLGFKARVGVGSNPSLAAFASVVAAPIKITRDASFLHGLPLEILRPPAEILHLLRRWGVMHIGQFVSLGRSAVVERLGGEGGALFDLAVGGSERPLRISSPATVFTETMDFEQEVEALEPLLFILRRFLDQICCRLEWSHLVAEEVVLVLRFAGGEDYRRVFAIPSPTTHVDTLLRMLQTHLETLRAEHPICGIDLSALPCRPVAQQFNLFETALKDPNHFHATLARLTGLLGTGRAGCPAAEPTYRADAVQVVSPLWRDHPRLGEARPALVGPPLRRFRPPVRAQVLLQENKPAVIQHPPFLGRIVECAGPWTSSGDWWDVQAWAREEWDVATHAGELYRLYRENNQWFLEGCYD